MQRKSSGESAEIVAAAVEAEAAAEPEPEAERKAKEAAEAAAQSEAGRLRDELARLQEQLDESRDVFAGAVVARLTFSFMNLRGGRNQLFVGNNK